MRTLFLVTLLFATCAAADAAVVRRHTRCCIMVPADDGGERPYCFVLNVRPPRYGRRICRLIGGQPQRAGVAAWR